MTVLKRKLYKRGSSIETTIPKPLLFELDLDKKHNVLFRFDSETRRWYIDFEPAESAGETGATEKEGKKRRS